jgi:nucleoside-diphosphate-sugar epimerase
MVEATQQKPICVITGITGYLGMHVVKTFLEDGTYRIRGTARNIS